MQALCSLSSSPVSQNSVSFVEHWCKGLKELHHQWSPSGRRERMLEPKDMENNLATFVVQRSVLEPTCWLERPSTILTSQ